ncbi:MAG: flagellar assembly protein FliW [Spirochaetota bacterium]|jgi:flagellar assembly factor FliW|nr:flagellar assembly protein FliW [Spirochaetota bacterium]
MKILTRIFGEIEISENQKIFIEEGLFGLEDVQEYVLLNSSEDSPFYWLQALDIPDIAFLLVDPTLVVKDYKLSVVEGDLDSINLKDNDDYLLFSIVNLNNDPAKTTANLLGPLVINKENHKAKQVISTNEKYSVRQLLHSEKEEEC